jgi:hypothetical protein
MAELKAYCGTELLGFVPRPESRNRIIVFRSSGENPGHPEEYWRDRGYAGDPTVKVYAYVIHPYWFDDNGDNPIPDTYPVAPSEEIGKRWRLEFVMVVPEDGETREFLHQIPGWRSAPARRIIDLPAF